jgi:FtsH-binding integral membrane protein
MKTFFKDHWLKLLAIAMLLGVLTNYFPFAYYQLTNWVVVGASITTAWQAYKKNNLWIAWFFGLVAVVFNPLAPMYIQQDIWRTIDIITATLFGLVIVLMSTMKKK